MYALPTLFHQNVAYTTPKKQTELVAVTLDKHAYPISDRSKRCTSRYQTRYTIIMYYYLLCTTRNFMYRLRFIFIIISAIGSLR